MSLPTLESLKIRSEANGQVLIVEMDHGRVNEIGSTEFGDWERLTEALQGIQARALITTSTRIGNMSQKPSLIEGHIARK
jgi:hypothetical protein